jgi:hypothetical protein
MPAPPFVTRAEISDGELRRIQAALFETLESPEMRSVKEDLLLERAEILPRDAYLPIVQSEQEALSAGYLEIQAARTARFPERLPIGRIDSV